MPGSLEAKSLYETGMIPSLRSSKGDTLAARVDTVGCRYRLSQFPDPLLFNC